MGAKVKEAGGGPATGLANDFVKFMQNGLNSGTFGAGPALPNSNPQGGAFGGLSDTLKGMQQTPQDNMNRANPVGSTEGIGGVINRFLGGDFGSQQYNPDVAGLQGQVGKGAYNFDPFSVQGADYSGFNTDALKNFNSGIKLDAFQGADVGPEFQQFINQLQAGNGASGNPFLQRLLDATQGGQREFSANLSNPNLDPYTADLDRSRQIGLANTRARYGASGGAAFGTPGAFAESNFMNEEAGKRASTLANIGQSQQALDLQRQLGEGSINAQNYGTFLSSLGQGAGLQNQGSQTGLDALLGRANMQNQAALGARGQDLQAMIAKGGLNLDALTSGLGMDLGSLNAQSQQGINIGQLMNQYQGMRSDNQLGAAGLDANILNQILGHQDQAAGLNENQRQFDVSSQGGMLNNLLQMFMGLSGKGLSQRETYQSPSTFQNVLGGITGIAGAVAPFVTGGIGGGMGGMFGRNQQQPLNTSGRPLDTGNWGVPQVLSRANG